MKKMKKSTARKIYKALNTLVVLIMVLQPVGTPGLLRAMAADEPATGAVSAPAPDPAPASDTKTDSTPKADTTPAPKETPVPAPAPDPTPAPAPKEEPKVEPAPIVETPAPVEAPAPADTVSADTVSTDTTPAPTTNDLATDGQTAPSVETQSTKGVITPEAASIEAPTVVPQENGDLNTVVVENIKANTVDLGAIDPTNVEKTAELATDKADYAPTDTAIITGTGFIPGQTYALTISSKDVPPVTKKVNVTADENGQFVYAYQLDGKYRPDYKVEAKNDFGDLVAKVTFTDGPPTNDPPICTIGVLNGDGVSNTVDLVLTCTNAVKFASSGTTTADGTDLAKIKLQPESDNHTPSSATISGSQMTLTFNAGDGTFAQNLDINAGALANSTDIPNDAISISSASITDHAKPIVTVDAINSPKLENTPFSFDWSNTEGGTVTYGGGCTGNINTTGWANWTDVLRWGGVAFPDGVYNSCTITVTDDSANHNSGTGNIPTFVVDTTGPVTGDVTVSPLYNNGATNYISALSNISAPVSDAGTGVEGASCEYSLDGGGNTHRDADSTYTGGVCSFTNINTSSATGINVRAQFDNGEYHQGAYDPAKNVPVVVDNTAPATTATATAGGSAYTFGNLTKHDITVTLSCADTGAGCDDTKYSTNEGSTWSDYTVPFTISNDSITSVQFYSSDFLDNEESPVNTETINLDNTSPTGGSITYSDGYYKANSIPVTYTTGTDTGSGLNLIS